MVPANSSLIVVLVKKFQRKKGRVRIEISRNTLGVYPAPLCSGCIRKNLAPFCKQRTNTYHVSFDTIKSHLVHPKDLRAGSHYDQFYQKLFTPGIKVCQHAFFLLGPLICAFSKISKSAKSIKDTGVLEWGWPIFPNSTKTKEPAAKAHNSCQYWLPIQTARSWNGKEQGTSSFRLMFSFRTPDRNMDRRTFFPVLLVKCRARPTFRTYGACGSRRRQRFRSCKRAAASNDLLCLFNLFSVIKINPNNWVCWHWIVSNNNNTVVMQIAPFGCMASFVMEDNFCR